MFIIAISIAEVKLAAWETHSKSYKTQKGLHA
jgi:hypothetical protein